MEDLFGINARRKAVAENIEKALGAGYEVNDPENPENEVQKGRVGVYEDNAENRRLNRVGQQYGKKKEKEEPKGKTPSKKEDEPSGKKGVTEKQDMSSHAAKASDGALKRAAADEKASEEVRNAAKEELKKRGNENSDNDKDNDKDVSGNDKDVSSKKEIDYDKLVDISDFGNHTKIKINDKVYKKVRGSNSLWIDEDGNTVNESKLGHNGFLDPSEVEEVTSYNQDEVMADEEREYMPTVYKGLRMKYNKEKGAHYTGDINGKKVEFIPNKEVSGDWVVYVDDEVVTKHSENLGEAFEITQRELNIKDESKK